MNRLTLILLLLIQSCLVFSQDMLSKMRSDEVITINEKEYYLHHVKRGQTLFMISKAYGVEVQDVIDENPEVKEGIQSGMKLKIPKKPDLSKKKNGKTEEQRPVPVPEAGQPSVTPEMVPCGQDKDNMKPVYNIALMMPLYLEEVLTIDASSVSAEDIPGIHSLQFLPFYEGFMMAVDSLKKLGFNLKISVYDVGKDTIKTKKLLRNPEMKNLDLIFGLLYQRTFQIVADFAQRNSIPIINPLSERDQIIVNNPYVIKVRPSLRTQPEQLVDYLNRHYAGVHVIFLRNKMEKIGSLPDSILSGLHAVTVFSTDEAVQQMRKNENNLLIVYSDNKSFILDVVTKINEVRNEFQVVLMGLPRWDGIEGIENEYLVNLKTHILAPYFVNYDDPAVKKFVNVYQEKYQTDPELLAFQGFDVAFYFSNALKLYGKNFENCLPGFRMRLLQTNFEFGNRSSRNGIENRHWELYMYENYRLVPLDH